MNRRLRGVNSMTNIEDLRQRARRRLPRTIFDFVDGGSQDELSLRANRTDFQKLAFRPRVLTDVSMRDQTTTVLGETLTSPLIIAPTGLAGVLRRDGEALEARAAANAGIAYCLSMMSACSIEQVARATSRPFWFQVYLLRDRGINVRLIERARAVGCRVLVLTVDTKAQGPRERDIRNGFTVPPRVTARNALDFARRFGWLTDVALGPRITFGNLAGSLVGSDDIISVARFAAEQYDPSINWSDLEWCKSNWHGPVAVKGVLTTQDARLAIEHGADAVIVSNHGGRQLDGSPSAISMLPMIAEVCTGRAEVILDGGIRRGSDVLKALALGARACMAGRPFLYGLAADGEAGVTRAIDILRTEIDVDLALLGRGCARQLDASALAWM
ncbi:MAG TPA: alpha-hydroxy acid oxidase [Burkholderiales bacterium]|nr:alpha-hydroxy acid oxidase [Burkholderiales bacterium]